MQLFKIGFYSSHNIYLYMVRPCCKSRLHMCKIKIVNFMSIYFLCSRKDIYPLDLLQFVFTSYNVIFSSYDKTNFLNWYIINILRYLCLNYLVIL